MLCFLGRCFMKIFLEILSYIVVLILKSISNLIIFILFREDGLILNIKLKNRV